MGQRHQIYVRLPKVDYGKSNPNTRGEKTIGIHHQWLYGKTALKLLKQYLEFNAIKDAEDKKFDSFTRNYDQLEKLAACYSLLAAEGYYHGVYQFTEENDKDCLADPRLGDNNDGITVIDLSKPEIEYCFMSIGHIEATNGENCRVLKPLSAIEYVTYYYPHWQKGLVQSRSDDKLEPCPELQAEISALAEFFKGYKVLSLARVKKIFPKMFKDEKSKPVKREKPILKAVRK